MKLSESTEIKLVAALISRTDLSGEWIRLLLDNIRKAKSLREVEALIVINIALCRRVEHGVSSDQGYYTSRELHSYTIAIKKHDYRCKDDITRLCNINCRWFHWCAICDKPLCRLHDDWIDDNDDGFLHKKEAQSLSNHMPMKMS